MIRNHSDYQPLALWLDARSSTRVSCTMQLVGLDFELVYVFCATLSERDQVITALKFPLCYDAVLE
jgi:hypothetical protein